MSCGSGEIVPYLGFIEVGISTEFLSKVDLDVPVLFLVSSTENYCEAPMIIGTNFLRLMKEHCIEESNIPEDWSKAFEHLVDSSVGTVKSTSMITLQPFEVRTVDGLVNKDR